MDEMSVFLPCFAGALAAASCGVPSESDPAVAVEQSALTGCLPGPNQVAWYLKDPSAFPTTSCGYLNLGFYPTPNPFPNDAIGAIHLGFGVRAVLFSDAHYAGAKTIISRDTSNLPTNTSAIRVERATDTRESPTTWPPFGAASVFTGFNNTGDCTTLHQDDQCVWNINPPGNFAIAEQCIGLPNDSISSAKIGPTTDVVFYNNVNFDASAGFQEIDNTQPAPVGFPDFRLESIGDNRVSSMSAIGESVNRRGTPDGGP